MPSERPRIALGVAMLVMNCLAALAGGGVAGFWTRNWIPQGLAVAAVLLSTVGMAALGCLFSALAVQTRARELLLPVLALPIWIPFVVYGAAALTGRAS